MYQPNHPFHFFVFVNRKKNWIAFGARLQKKVSVMMALDSYPVSKEYAWVTDKFCLVANQSDCVVYHHARPGENG